MRILIIFAFSAFLIVGCKTTAEQPSELEEAQPQMVDGIKGTVKYIDLEGGFYGIESEEGESYYPINLEEAFKKDGLEVIFKMKSRPEVVTLTMWGKTIELTQIEMI